MLIIRAADTEDAPAIARVHVETWRAAYTGIIPQHYLDGLTVQNRSIGWVRLLERGTRDTVTLVSETNDGNIVGFASAGRLRHDDVRYQGEISSLYVLPRYQRARHGRRLFLAAANRLVQSGHSGLFVWVLADNPARRFYDSLGGTVVAETIRNFAGKPLREIGYGWDNTPRYE